MCDRRFSSHNSCSFYCFCQCSGLINQWITFNNALFYTKIFKIVSVNAISFILHSLSPIHHFSFNKTFCKLVQQLRDRLRNVCQHSNINAQFIDGFKMEMTVFLVAFSSIFVMVCSLGLNEEFTWSKISYCWPNAEEPPSYIDYRYGRLKI